MLFCSRLLAYFHAWYSYATREGITSLECVMHSSDTGEKPQKMERCVLRTDFDQTVFICSQVIYRKSHWQTNLMTTYFSLNFRIMRCCIDRLMEIHCRRSTCKRNCSANEVVPWCHGAMVPVEYLLSCCVHAQGFCSWEQAKRDLILLPCNCS